MHILLLENLLRDWLRKLEEKCVLRVSNILNCIPSSVVFFFSNYTFICMGEGRQGRLGNKQRDKKKLILQLYLQFSDFFLPLQKAFRSILTKFDSNLSWTYSHLHFQRNICRINYVTLITKVRRPKAPDHGKGTNIYKTSWPQLPSALQVGSESPRTSQIEQQSSKEKYNFIQIKNRKFPDLWSLKTHTLSVRLSWSQFHPTRLAQYISVNGYHVNETESQAVSCKFYIVGNVKPCGTIHWKDWGAISSSFPYHLPHQHQIQLPMKEREPL